MRIAHLTSAHPRHDIRIFIKECATLARAGHEVTLIVADGLGEETRDGVRIVDVGAKSGGRLSRMTKTVARVIQAALALAPDVAHFHDPELMLAALKLKRAGIRVIYDVHEDLPRQLLAKHWIPAPIRPLASRVFERLENGVASRFDAIVTSTPHIRARFAAVNACVLDVCNFPILAELVRETPWDSRREEVCYLGGITRIRGIGPIVEAMPAVPARLNLAGIWGEAGLKDELTAAPGWDKVNDLGVLDRAGVADVLAHSKVGLVTLFPTPNYVDALPIKLFEYMAAGLPVVASDFPLWRGIVEDAGCGLLVDPQDPAAIAAAMNALLADDERAAAMGASGQRAALAKYSWQAEGEKLVALYARLAA
ncbi:MAG: glycosyltransferase family 4 protein [Paludibacterium sp.]|uniref:glycosyltransferase family 4 protein n=1 Tax=Paludibacterium sp. TaxID=1917523 RepID=UPI0025F25E31|nr:glycosyltransferase family 4 protein [Paludibacterium sp.]MBV8046604.1 glycosyltransferase family 4 protein [Paludibacterium sp.]MBV8648031.1 glycosyltransferase family 4 protein [Paludibacterium sp.]